MSTLRPAQHRNIPRGSLRNTARDRVHVCCGQRKATCSSSGRGARSPGRDCAGPGLLLRAPCSRGRPPGFLSLACAIRAHTTCACKPQCPVPGTSDGPVVSVKGRRGRSTGYACLVLGDEDPQYAVQVRSRRPREPMDGPPGHLVVSDLGRDACALRWLQDRGLVSFQGAARTLP